MHAHGANGRSLSFVVEVSRQMPESASSAEIAAASAAQPELPLEEHLSDWDAVVKGFKGPKLKRCKGGGGVGSIRRLVIFSVRGFRQGRGKRRLGLSRKEARALVDEMSKGELAKRAAAWGSLLGAPAGA